MATTTDLTGLFKEVYGQEVVNLVPESALLVKEVPFTTRDKQLGNKYHQPVIVQMEHGITYAGADAGAFALNNAISMKTQDAQVQGAQMVLRSTLDYESAARASGSKSAFMDATQLQVENMIQSLTKRLELSLLYGAGPTGLGTVDDTTNANATTTVLTFSAAGWAAGIWAGTENAQIDIFKVADGAKVNTNGALTIGSIDTSARTITVTGIAADITAIDTYSPTDMFVRFFGANGNEMAGLDKILTNTGVLFGIDGGVYNLWKGSTYAVGGAISFSALQTAVAVAVERGGLDEDVNVYLNPKKWGVLLNDQAALRKYDQSYTASSVENGSKTIVFHSQNGTLRIHAHPYVKEGEAFVLPTKRIKRIGAQDISFEIPGSKTGEIFRQLENSAGFEYRLYSNQAIVSETPAKMVKLTGIS